jgi:hypothetical protein
MNANDRENKNEGKEIKKYFQINGKQNLKINWLVKSG